MSSENEWIRLSNHEDIRRLRERALQLVECIETQIEQDVQSDSAEVQSLMESLAKIVEIMPDKLLGKLESEEEACGLVIELSKSEEDVEPIGVKLLITAALFEDSAAGRSIFDRLPTASPHGATGTVLFFLEEIRYHQLSFWKTVQQSIAVDSESFTQTPSRAKRRLEAQSLSGLFLLMQGSVPDQVADRLLPCVLYIVDDYDSTIASIGAKTIETFLTSSSDRSRKNWNEVLKISIANRLLSSDPTLWNTLIPVTLLFVQKQELQGKQRLSICIALVGQIFERLSTDSAPYDLADVFLDKATTFVDLLGQSIVRFFSTLFPLLSRWLFSTKPSIQHRSLLFLDHIILTAPQRISRHVEIINEILSKIETSTNDVNQAAIKQTKTHLKKYAQTVTSTPT